MEQLFSVRQDKSEDGITVPTEVASVQLARLAGAVGDLPALTFVDYSTDRNGQRRALTYAELDRAATATAAQLQRIVAPGERVAILLPQSLEYIVGFFGALRAGVIAVPLFSPDLPGHGDRLTSVLIDCEPKAVFALSSTRQLVVDFLASQAAGDDIAIIEIDTIPLELAEQYQPYDSDLADTAYLQYTSGSTRAPAGVQITHGNLVANASQAREALQGNDFDSRCDLVSWLPLFHDMGLVSVAGGILVGWNSILLDPIAFLMKPIRWIKELSSGNDSITSAPNFAFDFAASKITAEQKQGLRLDRVRSLGNGAEPVRPDTIARFNAAFAEQGLNPAAMRSIYGLAEATVYVSGGKGPQAGIATFDLGRFSEGVASAPTSEDVSVIRIPSSGTPIGQLVAIVDPATGEHLADGTIGEIWVNGPNVGNGYWNKPEASSQTFHRTLLYARDLPSEGWMSTGDLGTIHEGELYVTGRMKDVIIIDGRNHYPQDLEASVETVHQAIGRHRTAAFSIDTADGEAVVVVAEISRHAIDGDWDYSAMRAEVRQALTHRHNVAVADVVFTRPNEVPRTSSGKIARSATRDRYNAGELALVH